VFITKVDVQYLLRYSVLKRESSDQKRFTILEVAADWHELMIPRRSMRLS